MGTCGSREATDKFDVAKFYAERKLPELGPSDFSNEFEKEVIMMINLLRNDPKTFSTHLKKLKGKSSWILSELDNSGSYRSSRALKT